MSPLEVLLYVYAALLLLGGIYGFAKAKSSTSLIAGVVSAIVAVGAAYLLPHHPRIGSGLAGLVSVVLGVVFVRRYQQTKKPMPAMPIIAMSAIVLVAAAMKLLQSHPLAGH